MSTKQSKENLNIEDIATALDISKSTVSRAISGKGRIGAKTRERVLAYISLHDYHPNALAKGLANNKTYNLAFIVPLEFARLDLPFLRHSMNAVCAMAAQQDYDVLLSFCDENVLRPLRRLLDNRKVDGVILTRTLEQDPLILQLQKRNLPFVTMGCVKDKSVLQVDQEHIAGCKELTSLLLMKGFSKIALLSGNQRYMVNKLRLEGFSAAYQEAHKPIDQGLILSGLASRTHIITALDTALAAGSDCILCTDDSLARMVVQELNDRKIAIPEQMGVASMFESSAEETISRGIGITSLQFDSEALGRAACQLLLDRLSGETAMSKVLSGYQVILRKSTQ